VCLGAGDLAFYVAHGTGLVFVRCCAGSCAWQDVPTRVGVIESTDRFAPTGFRPATRCEVVAAGFTVSA
jgi:hypothetical protein